jgi:hypothetical protein
MSRAGVRVALILCGLLLTAPAALATIFSQDGWGWWWETGETGARSRGGTSVAITGFGATGEVNPATIALAHVSYGYLSYSGEVANVTGSGPGQDAGFRQRTDLLPHLGGVVALPNGLRFSAFFRAQSDASYEQAKVHTEGASGPYLLQAEGKGGLSRFEVVLATPALGGRLLWGIGIGRVQGLLKERFDQIFVSVEERSLQSFIDTRFRGTWVGSGGFVVTPDPRFALGVSGDVGGRSSILQETTVVQGSTFHEVYEGSQELPAKWATGVRVTPKAGVTASADVIRTLWGDARLDPGIGSPSYPFHDTTEWGVGIEYALGNAERPNWNFRGGFREADYHVRVQDTGDAVKEWTVSAGVGSRIARGRAVIDLGLLYGGRGDREKVGAEERFFRAEIGLSFSSTMREY